ncbi:MAG: PAS domain S-box protein [Steroidobacteraceae bacterium]
MDNTAAKQADDRFQAILESLPDAIVLVNREGHVILSNRQAVYLFGYAREELMGLPVEMLIQEPLRRSHLEMRRQFFASLMPRMMSAGRTGLLGLRKDGTTFPIEVSLGPIQLAHGVHVLAAVRDITERKQSEEANLRLAAIVESSSDAITGKTLDGIVTSWNSGAEHIFGYTAEEVIGKPVTILIPPDHLDEEPQIVERVRHGERIEHFETVRRRKDGRDIDVSLNISPIKDATGKIIGVSKIVRDITERERFRQRLRQAEKMEAVGRLAGGVAHDFNNVLAGVLAYGEMLFEEAPVDSPLKRYAQNVLTAASRGRELVEQILAYSRSQDGKRGPVDFANVVAETLELLRGSLPAGIRLEASAPELPLIVIGDATQLHQVAMNLCSNAIHAMSSGGTLRVILETVEIDAERVLLHGMLGPGRYARLIVEDSGSGMDEATLERIFEPFFTTKDVGHGTGLGLSLVYAIITDSGGAVEVQSTPGQGSTFTVYLRQAQAMQAAAAVGPSAPPRGHGERVLLIDDEAPVLAAAAEVLSRLGYEVVPFCDSRAALAAFEAAPQRFDVVVTDEVMSGLTGTEPARVLRHRRPDLPIVLLSGYSGAILTHGALAAGVSELLTKPLQSREMAAALARVLHRPV